MKIDYNLIGRRIKEIRREKNMSQAVLAELADLSVTYISQIECAARHPSLESIIKISDSLEVTADRLLYGNLKHNYSEYEKEFCEMISDCNNTEKKIIFETVLALKKILKLNKNYNQQMDE